MTSRERVIAALTHKESDRVPIDFSGHRSSGIMAIAYKKLKDYLSIRTGDIYVYDLIQQLAIVEPPVLDRFSVDTVELGRGFAMEESYWKDFQLPDGTPCKIPAYLNLKRKNGDWYIYADDGTPIAVQRESCLYFEQICWPLMDSQDEDFDDLFSAFEKIMWFKIGFPPAPISLDEDGLFELRQGAKILRQSTDRAIIGLFGGSLYEAGQYSFRIDNFLTMLAANPNRAHRFLDKLTEIHLQNLEKYLGAVGDYIDIIIFGGDDLGMQTGPQISKSMYDEFFKSRHRKLFTRAKEIAQVKVMLHSCGSIYKLLHSLVETGVDAINPVQTSAADMDPKLLKREFGNLLTFWGGGCDTQRILPRSTPGEVRRHVKNQVTILKQNGGFVFQQVHNIMSDVPPENIIAMFDAALECGKY